MSHRPYILTLVFLDESWFDFYGCFRYFWMHVHEANGLGFLARRGPLNLQHTR